MATMEISSSQLARQLAQITTQGLTKHAVAALREVLTAHGKVRAAKTSRGRARGGGQSSKGKGRDACQQVRAILLAAFGWEEDDVLVKATSMGGVDLHLSPKAQADFPFAIEVKNAERLNIWGALAQAKVNADKRRMQHILFFKRANTATYVALESRFFLSLLRSYMVMSDVH